MNAAGEPVIFLGSGEFAVPSLRALVQSGARMVGVISQPDRPAGRGRALQPTPVHRAADELKLPHFQVEDINCPGPHQAALQAAAIGIVAAFGQKLTAETLRALPRGFVNLHASLLPKYRGAAPYQWAIINGETSTGVTLFQLNERWDAGGILSCVATAIGETQTADELHDHLAGLAADLISRDVQALLVGELVARPQDPGLASRAPKLSRSDAFIDWNQPARRIASRINGLWSWPGATCLVQAAGESHVVRLARAKPVEDSATPVEANFRGALNPDFTIQANPGRVRILEIQPAGGRVMSFEAFRNGRALRPPARFVRHV